MSLDDPGWGGWTPQPGEQAAAVPDAAPATPATGTGAQRPPAPSSGGPPWWRRPVTLVVAAVVVVVGVAAVALGGSSSKSPSAPPTTVQAAPTTVAETSPASSAAPATVAGALSKADYIAAADGICARYKPQLDTATNSGNIAAAIPLLESELAEIEGLGSPATDAQIVRAAFEDITQAVPYLQAGDLTNANARILAGDTLAGQFGLQVCNYGH